MMGGLGMGFGIFGLVLMLFFWGGLIALAVWLVRGLFPRADRPSAPLTSRDLSARQVLDRRLARGEIDRQEYELMRETLSNEIA